MTCAGAVLLLGACGSGPDANVPGNTADESAYSGIAEDEAIRLVGTEPFWGGTVERGSFTYTTPENIDGISIAVTRFAGRGGLSFSGEVDGEAVDLAITPGDCSDGMSDRIYPYNATLQMGAEQRYGCAFVEGHDLGGEGEP
ncbi:COG3650 family protein [Aurantiacibacter odishensis]|uniref:COG3650 family protein n=1 Tax=Aurantiacibacter odishensis TaxID=1155476 RepID=UPI001F0C4A15|nr:hypothetical protein [Aurantiacibacter odishensis]